jgi:DNA-binding transcriptional MerR regulator
MLKPKDLLDQLGVSAPTLRVWSNTFAPVLSPGAQSSKTETGGNAQRRYTEEDLALFRYAKTFLDSGKTFEETLTALQSEPPPVMPPSAPASPERETEHSVALVTSPHPVIAAFEEALRSKDETIRAKDEVIGTLHLLLESKDKEVETLRTTTLQLTLQLTPITLQPRFRWAWLNKLLTGGSQHVG